MSIKELGKYSQRSQDCEEFFVRRCEVGQELFNMEREGGGSDIKGVL